MKKTPIPLAIEAGKAVHVYLVKEGIYLDERQAEQVALAIDSEISGFIRKQEKLIEDLENQILHGEEE
jgi:hypothetical protein